MKSIKLGHNYTDSVTGFSGIAIARIEYLTGCTQYQLQPKIDKDGKVPDSVWFDENRLSANATSTGGPAPSSLPSFGR